MNQEFPKASRDVLARQSAGDPHPSPDVLNAYVEHSLTPSEREQVVGHLAACAECRETVFLVNAVVEEPAVSPAGVPARSWRRWRWAIPAVALVAIVSAVLIQRQNVVKTSPPNLVATSRAPGPEAASPRFASQLPATPAPEAAKGSAVETKSHSDRIPATTTKPVPAKASPGKAITVEEALQAATSQQGSTVRMSIGAPAAPPPPAAAAENKQSAETIEQSLLKAAPADVPAVPGRNGFREEPAPERPGAMAVTPAMRLRIPSSWRITNDGQLERFVVGSSSWSPVLADKAAKFRVVAVVRNDVWAGGDSGVLFHSHDGGVDWSKISLSYGDHIEDGNITAIKFNTLQQGTIVTESGSRWTTSDGGRTWTSQ